MSFDKGSAVCSLNEAIEQFDRSLALPARRVRLVQDRRNAPLLIERATVQFEID